MGHVFSWISEGAGPRREAIAALKAAGIKAIGVRSPYVGHYAVEVLSNNKRVLRKAERILFGK